MRWKLLPGVGAAAATIGTTAWWYVKDVRPCATPHGSALELIASKNNVWYEDCFVLSIPADALPCCSESRRLDAFAKALFR
jgi:hypothetical protein